MSKKCCHFCKGPFKETVIVLLNGQKYVFPFCKECSETPDFYDKIILSCNKGEKRSKQECCPECSYSFKDFSEYRFMGCPACYRHFAPDATSYLKKIHASVVYKGKKPKKISNATSTRKEYGAKNR